MKISINPLEYSLTENALDSVKDTSHPPEKIYYREDQVSKQKTKTLVIIYPDSKTLHYMTPVVKGNKFYAAHLPDPVTLYLNLALKMENEAKKLKGEFENYVMVEFNKDRQDEFKIIDRNLYNSYIQMILSTVVFLHMTVESFINSIIPENFEFDCYDKEQIESSFSINDKITKVLSNAFEIKFHIDYAKHYSVIDNLIKLRNELVHLKTSRKNGNDLFIEQFEKLINFDCNKHIDSVVFFIDTFNPNHLRKE